MNNTKQRQLIELKESELSLVLGGNQTNGLGIDLIPYDKYQINPRNPTKPPGLKTS